jgi:hypothetical protein
MIVIASIEATRCVANYISCRYYRGRINFFVSDSTTSSIFGCGGCGDTICMQKHSSAQSFVRAHDPVFHAVTATFQKKKEGFALGFYNPFPYVFLENKEFRGAIEAIGNKCGEKIEMLETSESRIRKQPVRFHRAVRRTRESSSTDDKFCRL